MAAVDKIAERVERLRTYHAAVDRQHDEIILARRGEYERIAPDLFSDEIDRLTVANMIDTVARDFASVIAPLPTITCSSSSMLSDAARKFADKRSKIVNSYVEESHLQYQFSSFAADQFNSFGQMVLCVEPDFSEQQIRLRAKDARRTYPVFDSLGRVVEIARLYMRPWVDVCAEYDIPENSASSFPSGMTPDRLVEVCEYANRSTLVTFLPKMGNKVLVGPVANELGVVPYVVIQRPGLIPGAIRGAFDDVVWVQLIRHKLQLLTIKGVDDAVNAPLVAPNDANEIVLGADRIIRTQGGAQSVGRANLTLPNQVFTLGQILQQEQQIGSMSPSIRQGEMDSSVITGKGANALQGGWQSQVAAAQMQIAEGLRRILEMALKMDEKLFPNVDKDIKGKISGIPYSISYRPSRDIRGDYGVDVNYGFAAGSDPNRALIFLLQAQGAGLVSKDYAARNLPVGINPAEEQAKIYVEQSRDSLIQAFSALAQSIPQLAAEGGDPLAVIAATAKFIDQMQKGKQPEEAATEALRPPEPTPAPEAQGVPGMPGDPNAAPGAEGFGQSGLPAGLQPDIATEGQGGRPDLLQLFAGMSSNGKPNLSGGISRMNPVM